jgi:hypothetical protein
LADSSDTSDPKAGHPALPHLHELAAIPLNSCTRKKEPVMSLSEHLVLEADLELFRSGGPGAPIAANPREWALGFGPVGGTRPVWGLYLFDAADRVLHQRRLLWLLSPTEAELRRWCVRTVGTRAATGLLATVGDVTTFYQQYFATRPEMQGGPTPSASSDAAVGTADRPTVTVDGALRRAAQLAAWAPQFAEGAA